ncbi:MAG TPA: 5-deoxy-glucuronate isomerase [Chloroflexia bacterium]|nr:5-deoxy-glucuronate isomerase [Chloroflexia bacterium]
MRQYTADNLVIHPGNAADSDVVVAVTPEQAGWEYLSFQVRRLAAGQAWDFQTGEHELALVPLGGTFGVESDRGAWAGVGGRHDVFGGLPHALYLPRRSALRVTGETGGEFAVAWTPTDRDDAPRRVTPGDIAVEIRGGDHATRQINSIIPPGFPCRRLIVVEVYTPGGNWSSYPPHKHDVHTPALDGGILEADLEEIYYYKLDRPEGYAFQRIYTDPESPLHRAGRPIDAVVRAGHDDAVLIPEGYHPVASPPGYTTYYLNVLAGSAQSLANREDPRYAWVKETYQARDPRLPIYDVTGARG